MHASKESKKHHDMQNSLNFPQRPTALSRLQSKQDVRHGSVVIEGNKTLTSMEPLKENEQKGLHLNLTSRTNETITVEWSYCPEQSWMPLDHFLLEHCSVTNPDFLNVKLASNKRQYTLHNCTPGTNNYFFVSSIDIYGKVILRSKQLTVQSSAPINRPTLKLKKNFPSSITIEWSRPTEYGDGFISEYHLRVNGKFFTNIRSTKTSFDFNDCSPMEHHTFSIQALSIKPECNSEWSNALEVTNPAVLPVSLERLRPKTTNIVKVGWKLPTLVGGAKVKEFRVYFTEISADEDYNDKEPDADKTIIRTHKANATESFVTVDPAKSYWAILKGDIIPEGCPPLTTSPVRVRATIKPVAPEIKLTIYGEQERKEIDKEIAVLLDKQDKINRRKDLIHFSDKGAQLKNDEIQNMNVTLYQIEKRMQELTKVVNSLTGFVPVGLKWEKPEFDEFSEPTCYQININQGHQARLSLDCTEHSLKLDTKEENHSVSVTTLSWHPVGDSEQSNVEVVKPKLFRPNRFFCYFTSHKKAVSWPGKGGCRLEDFLTHEKKLTCKNNVHRGLVKTRIAPKPFRVMGIHDATWQQLIRWFGKQKSTIVLFWTKWCISSHNMLERFAIFAHTLKDKYQYLACCVKSGEDALSHRKSVIELLNEKNFRTLGNIRYCCACHPAPDMPHSTVEKMKNASIPASFDLVGVPTFVILDNKGQLAWQGRVAADNDETFYSYMSHVMSQVEEQECPNMECQHCKDEQGVTYEPKEDKDDNKEEENKNESNDNNPENKFSLDEFHLMHSRLHGKALEEAEKTEDEQYNKVGNLSSRKEWLEKPNNKTSLRSSTEREKLTAHSAEVSGKAKRDEAKSGRLSSRNKRGSNDFRNYPHRQPSREYRSPNTGYVKPKSGYRVLHEPTINQEKKITIEPTPQRIAENMPGKAQDNKYKFSSINYHASEEISTDDGKLEKNQGEFESEKSTHKAITCLGNHSSKESKQWNSSIKSNNIARDTTRNKDLSSTRPSWTAVEHHRDYEDTHEFMTPTHLRTAKDKMSPANNFLYPDIANKSHSTSDVSNPNGKQKDYTYIRPSAQRHLLEENTNKASKSTRKYSNIRSRYNQKEYKPAKQGYRARFSAQPMKRYLASQNNSNTLWQEQNAYERDAWSTGINRKATSTSARYGRHDYV